MAAPNYQADLRSGLHGVQEGAETAFNHATLDEKTAHGECPEGMAGVMFKMKCGVGAVSNNANRVFRREGAYDRYDMKDPSQGMDHTVPDGGQYDGTDFEMPEDHPELERPPLRKIDKYVQPECPCCSMSKRFTQAVLVACGFLISFGIRCNVGVATVKMMSNTTNDEGDVTTPAEFHWSPETIGYVDSSFFWGYIVTQLPGGFLASRFPANRLFGTAIFLSSCLNLLIPAATKLDPACVIVVRVLQGLVEGVTYPCVHGIWRWWAPPLERTKLGTMALAGSYGGAVLGMPVSGYLAEWIGWYAPFYAYGLAGVIWYAFWLWLSFEKPSKHPSISPREQLYIEKSLGDAKAKAPTIFTTPWGRVFTSMPVYAIIVANFARSWTFYLLLITQPKYFKERFDMNVAEGSTLAALPHLIMTTIVPLGGQLADYLRKNEIMTTTTVRKLFNCGGFGGEALFLLVVAYSHTETQAVVALIIAVGSSGFAISGFNVNHLDIAPRYASILMGISNGVGTFAGMICPIVTEQITKDETPGTPPDDAEIRLMWQKVFIIAALVHFVGVIFYAIFASGEIQDWAIAPPEDADNMMMTQGLAPGAMTTQANPNVDTAYVEEQDAMLAQGEKPPAATANPFTGQQASNPFR